MAHLTIRLQIDAATGKKNVIVSYTSDSDALPVEHEEEHRRLVEKLIAGGALKASELGTIVVEREQSAGRVSEGPTAAEDATAEGLKEKS